MNNPGEQKTAEQIVIENKFNRINEQNLDIKKFAEKEANIRRLAAVFNKSNRLAVIPYIIALAGILSMFLPFFIKNASVSVWTFVFDYGIPQKRIDGFDLNNLDFSVYGSAMYAFFYGKSVSDTLSSIRRLEYVLFCVGAATMLLIFVVYSIRVFMINSNSETRIRQNYDSPLRKKAVGKDLKNKVLSSDISWLGMKFEDFIFPIFLLPYPISLGIFLEDWFAGFMHINIVYYILPALFFVGAVVASILSIKYNKANSEELQEARAIYFAKF